MTKKLKLELNGFNLIVTTKAETENVKSNLANENT